MHELVKLAHETIKHYLEENETYSVSEYISEEWRKKQAGVFVSIHKKDGSLRGCIGTTAPTQSCVAMEVVANAISASTRDPRFTPMNIAEIEDIDINVDVLSAPDPVDSVADLDPKQYGVIVEKGMNKGLLLPDLEGINTVEQQLSIALQKAGIVGGLYGCNLYRFAVTRYT